MINEYGAIEKDNRSFEILRFLTSMKLDRQAGKHDFDKIVDFVNEWYLTRENLKTDGLIMPTN